MLDGCYVIKSDVPQDAADAQNLHDRYCDLENVERAFRTMKTSHLDLRPVYVSKASSTRGHVFVVMLALLLQRTLETAWSSLDVTVEEGIDELSAISAIEVSIGSMPPIQDIPKPTRLGAQLLDAIDVVLPSALPAAHPVVATRKKLPSERKR